MAKERPLFARNLTYLRNQAGLTRRKAAEISGIKLSSWSSYEEGRAKPNVDKLPGMCQALNYDNVVAMCTKDLANNKELILVDAGAAMRSLQTLKQFLEQIKK